METAQRTQYPLIKEYTLNHNIKALYSLIKGYWVLRLRHGVPHGGESSPNASRSGQASTGREEASLAVGLEIEA